MKYIGKYDKRYRKTSKLTAKISVYLPDETIGWLKERYNLPLRSALREAARVGAEIVRGQQRNMQRKQVAVMVDEELLLAAREAFSGVSDGEAVARLVEEARMVVK